MGLALAGPFSARRVFPIEGPSIPSLPSFESFSQCCEFFFFPIGFVTVEKFPRNLLGFVLCSKGAPGNENGPFFLNDLIDHQRNHIKTAPRAWRGCPRSLYLSSGIAGLRWCLANSPWLSLGTRMAREEGEAGGGLERFEEVELCFHP